MMRTAKTFGLEGNFGEGFYASLGEFGITEWLSNGQGAKKKKSPAHQSLRGQN